MIERHEIPLFEYDATSPEVIPPAHEFGDCRFPKKCLFAFLGDTIHRYAEANFAPSPPPIPSMYLRRTAKKSVLRRRRSVRRPQVPCWMR